MSLRRKLPFQVISVVASLFEASYLKFFLEHLYLFLSFLKVTLEWEKYRRFEDLSEEEIKRM